MSKARTLGNFVSNSNPLSDGVISASEVTGLSTVATSGSYADLSGKPSINSFLPTQTGNANKVLTTDGSTPSWGAVSDNSLMWNFMG